MSHPKRLLAVITLLVLIMILPWFGLNLLSQCDSAWYNVPGVDIAAKCLKAQSEFGVVDNDFFIFPSAEVGWKPDFNPVIFWLVAAIGALSVTVLLFPRLWGFRQVEIPMPKYELGAKGFPVWFWIGIVMHLLGWVGLFQMSDYFIALTHFQCLPLWWGYVLFLDGIVYFRTGGQSLIVQRPRTIIALASTSFGGWIFYEYLNSYIKGNWFFPSGGVIGEPAFHLYSVFGAAAFWPQIFEVYSLLGTFRFFRQRWAHGRQMAINKTFKWILLIVSFALMFIAPLYPEPLFWSVWLAPMLVLMVGLSLVKIWTPWTPIAMHGNWRPLILVAISGLIMGVHWEVWNHLGYKELEQRESVLDVAGLVEESKKPYTFVWRDTDTKSFAKPLSTSPFEYYSVEPDGSGQIFTTELEMMGGPAALCAMGKPAYIRSLPFEAQAVSGVIGVGDGYFGSRQTQNGPELFDDQAIQSMGGPKAAFDQGINTYRPLECAAVVAQQQVEAGYYLGTAGWVVVYSQNPPLWIYSLPYLDAFELPIGEMPVLGYFGYIPFGIYAWVWWMAFGYLLGTPLKVTLDDDDDDFETGLTA